MESSSLQVYFLPTLSNGNRQRTAADVVGVDRRATRNGRVAAGCLRVLDPVRPCSASAVLSIHGAHHWDRAKASRTAASPAPQRRPCTVLWAARAWHAERLRLAALPRLSRRRFPSHRACHAIRANQAGRGGRHGDLQASGCLARVAAANSELEAPGRRVSELAAGTERRGPGSRRPGLAEARAARRRAVPSRPAAVPHHPHGAEQPIPAVADQDLLLPLPPRAARVGPLHRADGLHPPAGWQGRRAGPDHTDGGGRGALWYACRASAAVHMRCNTAPPALGSRSPAVHLPRPFGCA